MINSEQSFQSVDSRTAAIFCPDAGRLQKLLALVALSSGVKLYADWSLNLIQPFHGQKNIDLLIADISSNSDRQDQDLSNLADYLIQSGVEALVWIEMKLLDMAYAVLPIGQCHFMLESNEIEALLIMSGVIRRGKMDQLHDNSRNSEFGALHRISDELAGFAKTLARIAEQDAEALQNSVADKPVSFRPFPEESGALLSLSKSQPLAAKNVQDISAKAIRDIIKMRRLRSVHFDNELFADPAWDILLDLLAAQLEKKTVSVSSLCIAATVPPTTALRWITSMTESGLLIRRHDPCDARRVFIELSEETSRKLFIYFEDAKRRNTHPV